MFKKINWKKVWETVKEVCPIVIGVVDGIIAITNAVIGAYNYKKATGTS